MSTADQIAWRSPTALELLPAGAPDRGFETMRVTSLYGWRDNPLYPTRSSARQVFHRGIDIGNHRRGDEVVAAAAGRVIAEGALFEPWSIAAPSTFGWWGDTYGGLMCVIDHGGAVSTYAHLNQTVVSVGQRVTAGQVIGTVGDTGSAKGAPHLHFEILIGGDYVDPWPLISAPTQTREERLAAEAIALRRAHPREADRFHRWTGLVPNFDSSKFTREHRLAAEVTFLREFEP